MSDQNRRSHIVISVHGIRTYGLWQKRIRDILRSDSRWLRDEQSKEALSYKYGVLTLLTFIVPFLRNWAVRQFRTYLEAVFDGRVCDRVDIIAHSFGTYLAVEALASPKLAAAVRVHTLILCGSAVSPNRDVSRLVGPDRRVGRLVNDCGTRDGVLLLTIPVFGVGMAGRLGLQGLEGAGLYNRYHSLGHSGYFERPGRRAYDGFMQRWWLPLLLGDAPVAERDRRPNNPGLSDRIWRFLGENGAKAAIILYAAVVAGLTWVVTDSVSSRRDADERRREALVAQSRFLAEQSQNLTRRSDYGDAIATALEALPDKASSPDRPLEASAIDALRTALRHYSHRATLSGHRSGLIAAAYSADGGRVLTGGYDGARLWDGESGRLINQLEDKEAGWLGVGTVRMAVFSADGEIAVTASGDGKIRLWNANNGELLARLNGHSRAVSTIAFSPLGFILSASDDGAARISDLDGTEIQKVELKGRVIRSAAFSPVPASEFVTASEAAVSGVVSRDTTQGAAHIWDSSSGELIAEFRSPSGSSNFALYSPDGKLVLVGEGSELGLWDVEAKNRINALAHDDIIVAASFSPDGEKLLSVSQDGQARVWETKSWRMLYQVPGVWGVFSPDGAKILTIEFGQDAATVRDAEDGQALVKLKGHAPSMRLTAAFSGDGRRIVTAGGDRTARLWNSEGGALFDKFNIFDRAGAPRFGASSIAFAAGGEVLVSSDNRSRHLWRIDSGRSIQSLPHEFTYRPIIAFAADGRRAVTADLTGNVELHDVARSESLGKFPGKGRGPPLHGATLSRDGARLAAWYSDGAARLWDAQQPTRFVELPAPKHGQIVRAMRFLASGETFTVFHDGTVRIADAMGKDVSIDAGGYERIRGFEASADGRRVIVIADDRTVEIKTVGSGKSPVVVRGDAFSIASATLTADGRRAAIGWRDNTARVIDAASGGDIATMKGHAAAVRAVRFSADGETLLTGSEDGTVRLWDATSGAEQALLPGHGVGLLAAIADIAASSDMRRIATLTTSGDVRIWRHFGDVASLVDFAKQIAPHCLAPAARIELKLAREPPAWCIAGFGGEHERDADKWVPKPPYQDTKWREWLVARNAGRNPALPAAPAP